jgi:hypothetical protein
MSVGAIIFSLVWGVFCFFLGTHYARNVDIDEMEFIPYDDCEFCKK